MLFVDQDFRPAPPAAGDTRLRLHHVDWTGRLAERCAAGAAVEIDAWLLETTMRGFVVDRHTAEFKRVDRGFLVGSDRLKSALACFLKAREPGAFLF
jgi:hypothetical protein